jgi:NADH-quinone oxidoreductase subunit L
MYLSIIFLPLLGSLIVGFLGNLVGRKGAVIITTFSVFLSSLFSLLAFYEVAICHSVCSFKLFT